MANIPVVEIFSSIQGEGPYVGVRQIFLRLPHCNLACPFCDTDFRLADFLHYESVPGSKAFEQIRNPLAAEQLLEILQRFDFSKHHSISITGGEPLLWSKELKVFLPMLQERGLKVYLETNGTLPNKLEEVLPWVDFVSMDIKLSFNGQSFWNEHQEFLRKSLAKEVFVKIVVDDLSLLADMERARDLIFNVAPETLAILQPVTATNGLNAPSPRQMLEWQDLFIQKLRNTRVIPQTHVLQGQL